MTRNRIASLVAIATIAVSVPVLAGPLLGGGEKPRAAAGPGGPGVVPPGPAEGLGGPGGPRGPRGHGGPGFGFGGGPILDRAIAELHGAVRFWEDEGLASQMNLTADQTAALQQSYDQTVAAVEGLEGSVRDSYKTLHEAVEVDEPNVSDVNAAIDAATNAQNEAMKIVLGHRVVVNNTLTAEQEEILKNSRRERVGDRLAQVRERFAGPHPPQDGAPGSEVRDRMRQRGERGGELREQFRGLMEDGDLSEDDWATIDAELRRVSDERIQQIRERISQLEADLDSVQSQDGPPRGPRPEGGRREGPRPR